MPLLGRFLSVDPVAGRELATTTTTPTTLNANDLTGNMLYDDDPISGPDGDGRTGDAGGPGESHEAKSDFAKEVQLERTVQIKEELARGDDTDEDDTDPTPASKFKGQASFYDDDELARFAFQHSGQGEANGELRPTFDEIRSALENDPIRENGYSQTVEEGNVRVIVNNVEPWWSTAYYFPGVADWIR